MKKSSTYLVKYEDKDNESQEKVLSSVSIKDTLEVASELRSSGCRDFKLYCKLYCLLSDSVKFQAVLESDENEEDEKKERQT
jgi:hypothetical protein